MDNLFLFPQPRSLITTAGEHTLKAERFMVLQAAEPFQLLFIAETLQKALEQTSNIHFGISASPTAPAELQAIVLDLATDSGIKDQGYVLTITPDQIVVKASTPAGLFYGAITLAQIAKQSQSALPCLEITDWPDFANRGFMLDISRTKVPTQETLLGLVDKLASWKINQLQLYTEHTFAYLNHKVVWEKSSPLTGEEILELDRYCRARFIELVPNQNTFGHMHRWLIHPEYADLAEIHGTFTVPWGTLEGPFSLDPTNPGSLELVKTLLDELLPHFSSRQINIGCDETFDLGQGKSKELCEQKGKDQVYLDFLLKVSQEVQARSYTVQFWGDIVLEHPELVAQLPKDLIALVWGYEANHPFELQSSQFAAANIPFYVCPGTSTWNTIAGRTDNALGNLLSAAEAGLKHGALGYLNTDWGDNGHWQSLPVSYLGIMAGAAYSWALETNRELDIARALDLYAFEDTAFAMGKLAYQLGNIYQLPGLSNFNSTQLFKILQYSPEQLEKAQQLPFQDDAQARYSLLRSVPGESLAQALEQIDATIELIDGAKISTSDARLIKREFELAAKLMRLACWRAMAALEETDFSKQYASDIASMVQEYKEVWLSRNRPGGLDESVTALTALEKKS